jgi:hypothetical protein
MANNNSTTKFGSYICKVGGLLDIYQKTTYEANAKGKAGAKTLKIKSRELSIYHAKKRIAGGFKGKEEAVKKALEILEGGMEMINSLKGKK